MCAVGLLKKPDLKVKLGGMRGIKGAVCASSRVVGSEEMSELQNKQTHISTIKTWHSKRIYVYVHKAAH